MEGCCIITKEICDDMDGGMDGASVREKEAARGAITSYTSM